MDKISVVVFDTEIKAYEVRSDYGRRTDSLKQAWELTKQALAA